LRAFNQTNATTITDDLELEAVEIHDVSSLRSKRIDRDTKCYSLSDTITRDNDTSGYGSHDDPSSTNNRGSSKVTFESIIAENSVPSSPKTKDQSVMAQIDIKGRLNCSNSSTANPQEHGRDASDNKNELTLPITSEGKTNTVSSSTKPAVKEFVRNPKTASHRKSKSQNRARKALRTITFILGAFVVCWTPWLVDLVLSRPIDIFSSRLGTSTLRFIRCAILARTAGSSPIPCFIVFTFSAT
jgi:hypothetical protein